MSVAEDGNEQEQPGASPRLTDRSARHRVSPTASATARVPVLPAPFNPAKPTFPARAAVPRQRRDGPTAIATASIPAVPIVDEPEFDAAESVAAEPVVVEPVDLFPGGELTEALPEEPAEDPFDVELRAALDPTPLPDPDPPADDVPDDLPADPATVGTLAGEARVSAAALADPTFTIVADDSPTVADYVPPAVAIVTDDLLDEDGTDYRGSRRKPAGWRRYPIGAVAVAVLLLLVTAAVVLQLVRDTGSTTPTSAAGQPSFTGMGALPGPTRTAGSPSPTAAPTSAGPSPSRSKAPVVPPPSASASRSPSPSVRALTVGRLRGTGSDKCLEYRSGENNRTVIDQCDTSPRRTNQRWSFQGDGTVRADGNCLDVQGAGTANGTAVQLYDCNGTPAQKWTRRADGTLLNPQSGRCLDVQSGGTGAGSPVIIWDCSAASNQQWTLQPF